MPKEVYLQQENGENYAFLEVKRSEGIQLLPIRVQPTQLPFESSPMGLPNKGSVFVHSPRANQLEADEPKLTKELVRVNGKQESKSKIPGLGKFREAKRVSQDKERSLAAWQSRFALDALKYKLIPGGMKSLNRFTDTLAKKDARVVAQDFLAGVKIEAVILAANLALLALFGAVTRDGFIAVGSNVLFQGIARNRYFLPRAKEELDLLKQEYQVRSEKIQNENRIKVLYLLLFIANFSPGFGTFTFPFISFPRNREISLMQLNIYKKKAKDIGENLLLRRRNNKFR